MSLKTLAASRRIADCEYTSSSRQERAPRHISLTDTERIRRRKFLAHANFCHCLVSVVFQLRNLCHRTREKPGTSRTSLVDEQVSEGDGRYAVFSLVRLACASGRRDESMLETNRRTVSHDMLISFASQILSWQPLSYAFMFSNGAQGAV